MTEKKKKSPLIKTSKTIKQTKKSKLIDELKKTSQSMSEANKGIPFWLPTGVASLDFAINSLGRGYPGGRLIYIKSSKESEGKSTLIAHAVVEMQKIGGVCKLYDTEDTFDSDEFASRFPGLDQDSLLLPYDPEDDECKIDTLETIFEDIEDTIATAAKVPDTPLLIAWDTVAATPSRAEDEKNVGDATIAQHARLNSVAFRRLIKRIRNHGKVILMFANQTRIKIPMGYRPSYLPPEETAIGERPLNFHSSVTIKLAKGKNIERRKVKVGTHVQASIIKNKVGEPFRVAPFDLIFKEGISGRESLFYLANEIGLVDSAGKAKYEILGETMTQKEFGNKLVEDGGYYESVRDAVKEKLSED